MKAFDFTTDKILRLFFSILIVFLGVYRGIIAFSYAPELTNGESNNIWNAINVSQGKPIYTNPEALPLEIFQYTPLSQLPIIVAAYVFDPNDQDYVHNIIVVGRLMSLLLNALTALMLFLACRLLVATDRWIIAFSCLLGFMLFTHAAFAVRPDASALFLMMTAFYLFAKHTVSKKYVHLFLAALVLALAFMTKQDSMVVIIPLSLALLLRSKWKQLILFDMVFLFSLAAIILWGHVALGHYFLTSIVNGIRNPSSLQQLEAVLVRFIDLYPFHFFAANTAIVAALLYHKKRPELLPLTLTTLFYEAFAVMTSAKIGSWVNYYTPFVLFGGVLIFVMLSEHWRQHHSLVRPISLLLVILVSGIFIFRQAYAFTSPYLKHTETKDHYVSQCNELSQLGKELQLQPDNRIMVVDPLMRIIMGRNTVMPNMEYYGISPFDYSLFRDNSTDKVDFIIFEPKDEATMHNLMQFFNIDSNQFIEMETSSDVVVLSQKKK